MTIRDILQNYCAELASARPDLSDSNVQSEIFEALSHYLDINHAELRRLVALNEPEFPITTTLETEMQDYIARRQNAEPMQHILGYAWFYGNKFAVTKGLFIPRPETEVLVERAVATVQNGEKNAVYQGGISASHAEILACQTDSLAQNNTNQKALRILDLCSGTGAIGLSIAQSCSAKGFAQSAKLPLAVASTAPSLLTDQVADTAGGTATSKLDIAVDFVDITYDETVTYNGKEYRKGDFVQQFNANFTLGDGRDAKIRTRFITTDAVEFLQNDAPNNEKYDLIVCNPPYVPSPEELTKRNIKLQPELDYDPPEALFGGGADGFALPSQIIQNVANKLADNGTFLIEFYDTQTEQVVRGLEKTGQFTNIEPFNDMNGVMRFVRADKSKIWSG